jgi:RimJ/RimL family protein N-acetyltransferase
VAPPTSLHTERLALDPWTAADGRLMADLARTPAVMRYIGDGAPWSDARIADVGARVLAHWRDHDFGWRVAREDGAPVGLIALNFAGEGSGVDSGEYEIGWWLAPSAWGRGLAREGAAAVRDEAFERVGAPSIVARIRPENAASLAVAAAIGLRYESQGIGRGGETFSLLRLSSGPGSPPAARPGAPA